MGTISASIQSKALQLATSEQGALAASAEMIEGYSDGLDLDCPEPSLNRSASYRHGFANGRADKTGVSRGLPVAELHRLADAAMREDEARSGSIPVVEVKG